MSTAHRWIDQAPLEPSWLAPKAPPRHRGLKIALAIVVVLAVLTGLIWALGGFNMAKNTLVRQPAGTVVEVGPMRVSFTHVIAEKRDIGRKYWNLTAVGTCQSTWDQPVTGGVLSRQAFAARDVASGKVMEYQTINYGSMDALAGSILNPGLQPQPCRVTFELEGDGELGSHLLLGVFTMDYKDNSITQSGEKRWVVDGNGYQFYLPITVEGD